MNDTPISEREIKNLRYLRWLVTALTLVMIFGLLTIVGLLVMRFGAPEEVPLSMPVALPDGAKVQAFTQGRDWMAIVTEDNRILIYDKSGKDLRQEFRIGN